MIPSGRLPSFTELASGILHVVHEAISKIDPAINFNVSEIMKEFAEEMKSVSPEDMSSRKIETAITAAIVHQTDKASKSASRAIHSANSSLGSSQESVGNVDSDYESGDFDDKVDLEEAQLRQELELLKEAHKTIEGLETRQRSISNFEASTAALSEKLSSYVEKLQKNKTALRTLETTLEIIKSGATPEKKKEIDSALSSLPTARAELRELLKVANALLEETNKSQRVSLLEQREKSFHVASTLKQQASHLSEIIGSMQTEEIPGDKAERAAMQRDLQKAINAMTLVEGTIGKTSSVSALKEQVAALTNACVQLKSVIELTTNKFENQVGARPASTDIVDATKTEPARVLTKGSIIKERQEALRESIKRAEEKKQSTQATSSAKDSIESRGRDVEDLKKIASDKARLMPQGRRGRTK